jgi:flagellar basal body-associated protein FliL
MKTTLKISIALLSIVLSSFTFKNNHQSTATSQITQNTTVVKPQFIAENETNLINTSTPKNVVKQKSSNNSSETSALKVIGWLIFGIGVFILLFLSILLGLIAMGLGLIFVISGKSSKENSPKTEEKMEDVVYLKNGGITRGIIIEQKPNIELKIETREGNIFVYKMDEIIKITKEPKFKK